MTEDERAVMRETLIKEGVGLLAVLAVVWYMGPGRILIGGLRRRAEIFREGRRSDIDVQVSEFGQKVSRWEHEQAAKAARRAGGERGCGCG
jgi:hypothetical protein